MTEPAPGFPDDAKLLDAVLVAFAERGYDGMSVREIARTLGVSHNFIPQRFGSKERLWFAAIDHAFGEVLVEIERATAAAEPHDQAPVGGLVAAADDAARDEAVDVDQFRAVVVRFVTAMGLRPALLQIIGQEAARPGPRLDYLFTRYIEPVGEMGTELLGQLGAEGKVRTSSVSLVYFLMTHGAGGAFALPGLAERFGEAVDSRDPEAVRAHAEHAVDVLFHGLAT